MKRIHRNSHVIVEPCNRKGIALGPQLPAHARICAPVEHARINTFLNQKYGVIKRFINVIARLRKATSMDMIYTIGPSVMAAITVLIIATYTWNTMRSASIVVMVWGVLAITIGQISFFTGLTEWQASDWIGFLLFGVLTFTPAGLLLVTAGRMQSLKHLMAQTPTSVLVMTQVYRFGGVFLIMAYARGQLPLAVGLVTGVVDLVVATTALALSVYLRCNETRAPMLVIAWAMLAIADFVWAVSLITVSFLGVIQLTPAPVMMGNAPLLVISLFAVPFGIFVSVYVVARMWTIAGRTDSSRNC